MATLEEFAAGSEKFTDVVSDEHLEEMRLIIAKRNGIGPKTMHRWLTNDLGYKVTYGQVGNWVTRERA